MSKAKNTTAPVNFVLVDCFGEFQGLYKNGKLLVQDNGLNLQEYLSREPKTQVLTFETVNLSEDSDMAQSIYQDGSFPQKLSTIKVA